MTPRRDAAKQWTRWAGLTAIFLTFAAGVVVLMLWLAGRFAPKVSEIPATDRAPAAEAPGQVVPVRVVQRERSESAVGTIRAVHETSIGSRLLSRVVEVNLKAGQQVQAGDVLIRLDDTDLQAKLQQAKAGVTAAEALQTQLAADEKRYAELLKTSAISRQQYEKAVEALQTAQANLHRTQEAVKEMQAMLNWATIRSPMDGTVIDKKVDVGDMVTPGQMLVTLLDPKRMQLVASVREALTRQLQVGQSIGVQVEGLNKQCSGTVSEIVPEAQSASRTFQVKVTGPCPTGIYSGMFGRILVPLGKESILVIPRLAVESVGQLKLVTVIEHGQTSRRAIRTGRTLEADVEVLSGLCEGEQVLVPAVAKAAQKAPHDIPAFAHIQGRLLCGTAGLLSGSGYRASDRGWT